MDGRVVVYTTRNPINASDHCLQVIRYAPIATFYMIQIYTHNIYQNEAKNFNFLIDKKKRKIDHFFRILNFMLNSPFS